VQRAESVKGKKRNGGNGEMARAMDQIPFIMMVAMKGHATGH
jgi:hypothetical protein